VLEAHRAVVRDGVHDPGRAALALLGRDRADQPATREVRDRAVHARPRHRPHLPEGAARGQFARDREAVRRLLGDHPQHGPLTRQQIRVRIGLHRASVPLVTALRRRGAKMGSYALDLSRASSSHHRAMTSSAVVAAET